MKKFRKNKKNWKRKFKKNFRRKLPFKKKLKIMKMKNKKKNYFFKRKVEKALNVERKELL